MGGPPLAVDCANCGAALTGPFCAACGQEARPPNPGLRYFLQDLARDLFDYDGKVFRSVWLLFARPGYLTREAFADKRASYISPLKLHLSFSVLFFAVLALAPNVIDFKLNYTPSQGEQLDPAVMAGKQNEVRAAINDVTNRRLPQAMFVLMPVFAALVMLFRRKSGRTYPQHLYFAMHVHAVAFFAATVIAIANIVVVPYLSAGAKTAGLVFVFAHSVLAFRNAYDTSWLGALWRMTFVGLVYWVVLVFTLIGIWLPSILDLINRH